jgi:predicted nucleic acid-binding protein
MGVAIDTNVLIALWNPDDTLNMAARNALDASVSYGPLVISAPVYAELSSFPTRTESFLDKFLSDTEIRVDWEISEPIWRFAGRAYQQYFHSPEKKRGGTASNSDRFLNRGSRGS